MNQSLITLVILMFCHSSLGQTRPTIELSCGIPTSLPQWQSLETLYQEAFEALGYDFSMVYVNTKRMFYEHKYSDKYDGICAFTRLPNAKLREYDMVMVEAPVGDPETAVWRNKNTTSPTKKSNGTDDLPILQANTQVGYLRGNTIALRYISKFETVTPVTFIKPNLGIKTLAAGRIDYWIGFAYTADFLTEQLALLNTVEKVAIIQRDLFYPLLKNQHSNLKQPLEQQIRLAIERRGGLIK